MGRVACLGYLGRQEAFAQSLGRCRATKPAISPATGEDATDYFFRTPGELCKSGLFDEKDHCGSKLASLIGRTASSNTALGCKNHGYL
jgi:hypothetical protein